MIFVTCGFVDTFSERLIEFTKLLESYAAWLRNDGILISSESKTGIIVTEVGNEDFMNIAKPRSDYFIIFNNQYVHKYRPLFLYLLILVANESCHRYMSNGIAILGYRS